MSLIFDHWKRDEDGMFCDKIKPIIPLSRLGYLKNRLIRIKKGERVLKVYVDGYDDFLQFDSKIEQKYNIKVRYI